MAPFDELQALWQSQNPLPPAVAPAAISKAFQRYGRRQDLINLGKCAIIAFVLVRSAMAFSHRPLMLLATLVMLGAGAIAVAAEWRIQRGIARLDFSTPSINFVRGAIAHLETQRNPFHTPAYMTLFGSIFISYNLFVVVAWPQLSVPRRILWHGLASSFPALLYAFSRWCRAKRFNADYRPLIERLRILLDTLEERAA